MKNNDIIEKAEALKLVEHIILGKNKDITRSYISKEILKISEVKDIMEENIYEYDTDYSGWLVYVDCNIVGNWAHKCEYYFITSDKKIVEELDNVWMPSNDIQMELIKIQGE